MEDMLPADPSPEHDLEADLGTHGIDPEPVLLVTGQEVHPDGSIR